MADERASSLGYERPASAGVSRWQFRLLLLLVLASLAITIQSAYAPQLAAQVKKRWANYRTARQTKAVSRRAWAFTQPPSNVVWDEDPQSAAKLLAGPGYHSVGVNGLDHRPWSAGRKAPARRSLPKLTSFTAGTSATRSRTFRVSDRSRRTKRPRC